ncbi:MAG: glycosyltransferase family 4 protein [Bacteroidia bacterium]
MKIALLTDGIYPYVMGGMQKHSYCLAKYLAGLQVYVDLYHYIPGGAGNKGEVFTEEERKFITLVELEFPQRGFLPGHYLHESFEYSTRIWEAYKRRSGVDFIYAKGFTAWKLLDIKAKGEHLPPVGVNFHGYEMFQAPASFKSRLEQYLLRGPVRFCLIHADHIFSYGGKITGMLTDIGVPLNKIIVLPAGIEKEWINEDQVQTGSARRFIFAGRYERRKGIEELTRVLDNWAGPEIHFTFAGPIPESKRLKRSWIQYTGGIENSDRMKEVMRNADVLVCPSHSEGMPNVILEAMAGGLAVIATDVGAVSEMVCGQNGWLIEPASEEALRKALMDAVEMDASVLDEKRRRSVSRVRDLFTWDVLAKQTFNMIREKTSLTQL